MIAFDNQCFSSSFGIGVRQAGFEIGGKTEYPGGFGSALVKSNPHVFGDIPIIEATPDEWHSFGLKVDMLFGNPACSAFSQLTLADKTLDFGTSSKYLEGQQDFVKFAAKTKPTIAVFESVQGAYRVGRQVMREYLSELNALSGLEYQLTHLLMDCAIVGGKQRRRRYFWVAHLVPFGVLPPSSDDAPPMEDVIGDLAYLPLGWDSIPDAHVTKDTKDTRRLVALAEMAEKLGAPWKGKEYVYQVAARFPDEVIAQHVPDLVYTEKDAAAANKIRSRRGLPDVKAGDLSKQLFHATAFSPYRARRDHPSKVITGGLMSRVLHPWENRMMTYREAARFMGYPDDVSIAQMIRVSGDTVIGKSVPVESGRWVAESARLSLEGRHDELVMGVRIDGGDDLIVDLESIAKPQIGYAVDIELDEVATQLPFEWTSWAS